jgi:hypothetical protein
MCLGCSIHCGRRKDETDKLYVERLKSVCEETYGTFSVTVLKTLGIYKEISGKNFCLSESLSDNSCVGNLLLILKRCEFCRHFYGNIQDTPSY